MNAITQVAAINPRKTKNHLPIEDCAKAWTELTRPLRVSSVPKIDSMKVMKISHMFQIFSMPRFSCIITECRKAVPVSHGINEAFSTGSQPQYPPQPRTEYAQCAPRKTPQVRNIHVTMVQRRGGGSHLSPGGHLMRRATAEAKRTVKSTQPR